MSDCSASLNHFPCVEKSDFQFFHTFLSPASQVLAFFRVEGGLLVWSKPSPPDPVGFMAAEFPVVCRWRASFPL
jgi:hypothetical protein